MYGRGGRAPGADARRLRRADRGVEARRPQAQVGRPPRWPPATAPHRQKVPASAVSERAARARPTRPVSCDVPPSTQLGRQSVFAKSSSDTGTSRSRARSAATGVGAASVRIGALRRARNASSRLPLRGRRVRHRHQGDRRRRRVGCHPRERGHAGHQRRRAPLDEGLQARGAPGRRPSATAGWPSALAFGSAVRLAVRRVRAPGDHLHAGDRREDLAGHSATGRNLPALSSSIPMSASMIWWARTSSLFGSRNCTNEPR